VPPRKSPTLTEAELRIMEVLWEKGAGTVQQVLDWLPAKPALAYNSKKKGQELFKKEE